MSKNTDGSGPVIISPDPDQRKIPGSSRSESETPFYFIVNSWLSRDPCLLKKITFCNCPPGSEPRGPADSGGILHSASHSSPTATNLSSKFRPTVIRISYLLFAKFTMNRKEDRIHFWRIRIKLVFSMRIRIQMRIRVQPYKTAIWLKLVYKKNTVWRVCSTDCSHFKLNLFFKF